MATPAQGGRNIDQGEHIKFFWVPELDLGLELDPGGHKINKDKRVKS